MSKKLSIFEIYTEVLSLYDIGREIYGINDINKLRLILIDVKARAKRYPENINEVTEVTKEDSDNNQQTKKKDLLQKLDIAERNLDEVTLKGLHLVSNDLIKALENQIRTLEELENKKYGQFNGKH